MTRETLGLIENIQANIETSNKAELKDAIAKFWSIEEEIDNCQNYLEIVQTWQEQIDAGEWD